MAMVHKIHNGHGVYIRFAGEVKGLEGFLANDWIPCMCFGRPGSGHSNGKSWTILEYLEHHAENGIYELAVGL